jgi:hypothetical protein
MVLSCVRPNELTEYLDKRGTFLTNWDTTSLKAKTSIRGVISPKLKQFSKRVSFFIHDHVKTPNFRDAKHLCHMSQFHIKLGAFRQEVCVLDVIQFLLCHCQQKFCARTSLGVNTLAELTVHSSVSS